MAESERHSVPLSAAALPTDWGGLGAGQRVGLGPLPGAGLRLAVGTKAPAVTPPAVSPTAKLRAPSHGGGFAQAEFRLLL